MIREKIHQYMSFVILDVVIDMFIFCLVFGFAFFHKTKTMHFNLGIAIALISFGFWILSRIHLGTNFTVSAKAKKLVTNGMYSKIRNPIYVFSLLSFTGALIAIGEPKLFLFLLPFVVMEIIRASKEQKVLYEAFGEEYHEYRKKTWF